ncbi:Clas27 [Clostera anastomosis granulovirus B]|uniref:Clas27 n=1 Tax=Clostera anastomosis granulovirus B TaxID=1986290 RepID=A0A0K0WS43_9BBAC|nr:Clas27 [Clostera anastomosis granulovirus B]AKS25370.1 Clas27 [Clostera anastomosis granulovirus B]
MHEDIMVVLKNYTRKYNLLDDSYHELKQQYDKTQYELRCIKNILLDVCLLVAPDKQHVVQQMLDKHDSRYKTQFELNSSASAPLASIRFDYQLKPDLGAKYLWDMGF